MFLNHVWGLFTHPQQEWQEISRSNCSIGKCYCSHVLLLAAIPAIFGFVGTTQIGWQIASHEVVKLTTQSALPIAVIFYITMLIGVFTMGKMIHWMAQTYGTHKTLSQCIALAAYTATPLFLIGIMLIYPILWLNMILGIPALGYSIYLLYVGVPIVMDIPVERGFLLSSAIMAVGLVMLVAVLAATVILWAFGIGPQYTSGLETPFINVIPHA